MSRFNDYYYKGYDVTNNNRLEKLRFELSNPFGYNLGSNARRVVDYEKEVIRTNQDVVKNNVIMKKSN